MVDVANSEFFAANVSTVTTDFSVSPYYDDFDGRKNYYKVLFKPGFAVQARELTQLQSMLQDQISRFGQHIFKEGSKVLGGKFYVDVKAPYVKVNDKDTDNLDVDITRFKNQIVTGQVTGIQAYINLVEDGAEGTDEPKTLYVSYLSGNPDTDEITFAANEPLVANVGTLVVSNTNPVGYGSVFTINEGIRYAKEHFIYNSKQSVVIDRYGTQPTCQVGFYLQESIVDSNEDSSLLDPALESSNYFAPGADRFKIVPILTRIDIDDVAGPPDYVNLFIIENGIVTEVNERPIYNIIRDELAKRTLDESGDYYVRGFNTIIEEHLDNGENDGYLTLDRGGNSQLLSIQVEGGTAYVKGYEVNKLVTSFLETEKSTSFSNVNGQIISSSLGNYVVANEGFGNTYNFIATSTSNYAVATQIPKLFVPTAFVPNGYNPVFESLQKEVFGDIVKKDKESVKNIDGTIWHQLDQSNRLVGEYKYPGAIGVKTGYMPEAGHCLVGAAERNGHTLIAIVLATSADTPSASADESKKLLDWGFRSVEWQQ